MLIVGPATRAAITAACAATPALSGREWRVLGAVLHLTTSWSRLADSTDLKDLARITYSIAPGGDVPSWQRRRVGEALHRLRDAGCITLESRRGVARYTVGLPYFDATSPPNRGYPGSGVTSANGDPETKVTLPEDGYPGTGDKGYPDAGVNGHPGTGVTTTREVFREFPSEETAVEILQRIGRQPRSRQNQLKAAVSYGERMARTAGLDRAGFVEGLQGSEYDDERQQLALAAFDDERRAQAGQGAA